MKAAAYALHDNAQTVSSAVTLGTEMRQGTGSFRLLLDTEALPELPDQPNDLRLVSPVVDDQVKDGAFNEGRTVAVSQFGLSDAVSVFTSGMGSQVSATANTTSRWSNGTTQSTNGSGRVSVYTSAQTKSRSVSSRVSATSRVTSSVITSSNRSRSMGSKNTASNNNGGEEGQV